MDIKEAWELIEYRKQLASLEKSKQDKAEAEEN